MEFNQTIVMITHNNEIAQLADRIVRIEDGRIMGYSTGTELEQEAEDHDMAF